ncbi:MAG TPA: hypothetical protein VIP05_32970, partial [Burkholderiaceae bacterium]
MRASSSRAMLALTLAAGLAGAAPAFAARAASAAEAPASAASQPANSVRPAFAGPFGAAQEALKNGNGTLALAKLKELDAIPDQTPYEKYLVLRVRAPAEYSVNDFNAAAADFDAILASPLLPAEDRLIMMKSLAGIYYGSEQYAKAAVAIQRYLDAGGNDAQLKELLPQAQYAAKDYANAAKGFRAQVDADYAAGKVPTEKQLRLLYSAYVGLKDEAGIVVAMEHLAVNYPKADYWRDLIPRAREVDNFSERLVLDYYRLKAQVFGQVDDRERLNYAALAARAGYPGEAKKVLDAAAAGKVPTEKQLRLLYSAYVGLKDDAGVVAAMEHLAVNYPKADYWRDLIPRVREVDNFPERLVLDYYRLKAQVFGQVDDRERLNYAALAARAGYPGEA